MSEPGKAAAEFALIPSKATEVSGRTVYPDGREVVFQSRKDFQTKVVYSNNKESVERRLLIPPGLTDDCVVELRYREMADWARPKTQSIGNMHSWVLAYEYPTLSYTVEISKLLPWAWHASYSTLQRVQQGEQNGRRVVTFGSIKALPPVPYVRECERDAPRIHVFEVPEDFSMVARTGGDAYWNAFADKWVKHWFMDAVVKGGAYRDFMASLAEGMPVGNQAQAGEVLYRLERKVRNRSYPNFQEEGDKSRPNEDGEDMKSLSDMLKRGFASPWGMRMLLFNVLRDLGIPVRIVLAADRDRREVSKTQPNFQQFHDVLFTVAEEGKPSLLLDPGTRYSLAGVIPSEYQGTQALVIDPATWKCSFEKLPVQPAALNQERFSYRVVPGEGEDQFEVTAEYSGLPCFRERHRYMALDPAAQQKTLKSRLGGDNRQVALVKAEIQKLLEPGTNLKWLVAGTREGESGSLRTIQPFPVHRLPLWIPSDLSKSREDAIQLPFLLEHTATSEIAIPAGYRFGGSAPYSQENSFGRVEWNAVAPSEGKVQVTFKVAVRKADGSNYDIGSLKRFLEWMQQAQGKAVLLEKVP